MCEWGTDKIVKLYKPMPVSGRNEIAVDSCLADLVQALNNAGIETTGCCCGHGKGDGDIQLADGRILIIKRAAGPES
ncbi:MAG TPA: hypothetical protein PKL83_05290 [bacterium]|nr:hypothetical protein [bacterium]